MKKILYIGNFSFPLGNAAGKRVYANGKILRNIGYEVIYIGVDKTKTKSNLIGDTETIYDGFKYYNFSYPSNSKEWLDYNSTFKALVKFINSKIDINTIEMIIYYGTPTLSFFISKLINYCKINNITIIADCVDWLTVKTDNLIFDAIKWADNTYQKAYLNRKVDGLIAISRFLEAYYSKFNIKTVIIPPLSPIDFCEVQSNNHDDKQIIYAGIPFRKGILIKNTNTLKDRIDKTIILLFKAKERGAKFKFHIYGFTKNEYLEVLPQQNKYIVGLGDSIEFHGIKPNDVVTDEISMADFSILIRDVSRDTTAGFPTKISESLSYRTPVITTRTSDLEKYIIDGKNGFFINADINSVDEIVHILQLTKEKVYEMKLNCQEMNNFSYKLYENELASFLESLSKKDKWR